MIVKCSVVGEITKEITVKDRVNCAREVVHVLRQVIGDEPREVFLVILLGARNNPLSVHVVSIGIANGSLVHPREVFVNAIRERAVGIIACHNHPSGDIQPSNDDKTITKRLTDVGELVGIRLVDHVIAGDGCWYSIIRKTEGSLL